MADHLQEGVGTFVAAVAWGVGACASFVLLAGATNQIVQLTVKRGSPDWRAVAAAVVATALLTCGVALMVLAARGLGVLPARRRQRRAQAAIQARRVNQERGSQAPR